MTAVSPIEVVTFAGRRIVLKREDLLPHGGGNKVHRFDGLFARLGRVRRVVALSEPGAHSLLVLADYVARPGDDRGAESVLLLEISMPLTPYARSLQARYRNREGVEVRSGPLWRQILRLTWHRGSGLFTGTRTVSIGGSVRLRPNPFAAVLTTCRRQLDEAGLAERALHLFPIASGQMALGFLERLRRHRGHDRLVAVTTGPAISRTWLRLRLAASRRLTLHAARPFDDAGYRELATRFHEQTGVWLDPRHTIQLAAWLEDQAVPAGYLPVLWITCPKVDGLPAAAE